MCFPRAFLSLQDSNERTHFQNLFKETPNERLIPKSQKENLMRWTTYSKEDNTTICKYASFRKPVLKFSTIENIQQCMDLPTQEYALSLLT